MYLSTQKLRTPKGLDWLRDKVGTTDRRAILKRMMQFRQLFCAIWAESVWLIANASKSETKFIVSDHPVTVYNRCYGPRSQWCRGHNDPDIWLNGTHTIFPLSLDHILILTNLAWVRNPYQSPTKARPNPNPFRSAIFSFLGIQTERQLSEQEVREINFIIRMRAFRYVAAGKPPYSPDPEPQSRCRPLCVNPRAVRIKGGPLRLAQLIIHLPCVRISSESFSSVK